MDNFVSREEFNSLKQEVQDIKKDLAESEKILQKIDKKIDIISEKIESQDEVNDLKMKPLEDRVDKLESNQLWMVRAIVGSVFAIIGEAVLYVIQLKGGV